MNKVGIVSFALIILCLNSYGRPTKEILLFNRSNKVINSYYIDNTVSFGHPVNLLLNDSVSIRAESEIVLFISDAFQTMYILKPGERYYFDFDGRVVLRCIECNDLGKKEFYFFEKLSSATGPLRNLMSITLSDNSYENRQNYINGLFDRRISFLNNYLNDKLYDSFKITAKAVIQAYFIKESLSFPKTSTEQYKEFYNSYRGKIDTFKTLITKIHNKYYPFREAAFAYNEYINNSFPSGNDTLSLETIDIDAYKQYLSHRIALKILKAKSIQQLDSIKFISSTISFPIDVTNEISDRLNDKYSEFNLPHLIDDKVLTLDSIVSPITSIFKSKQKVLYYVDFWASWCQPCLNEFKYYKNLDKLIKEKKVQVVFVSMDDSYRSWKKTNFQYLSMMSRKNSLFLLGNFKAQFAVSHRITSIPRYMIFDRYGKILDGNAPYPSNDSTISIVENLFNTMK